MKTKSFFLGLFGLFLVSGASAQQLGNGVADKVSTFNANLPSGFYRTDATMSNYPHEISAWPWKHLINMRSNDGYTTTLFQLSAAYTQDDRLFFRKAVVDHNNPNVNNQWYELATRGENAFIGSQKFRHDIVLAPTDGTTPFGQYGGKLYFGNGGADNNDDLFISRWNNANDQSELRINLGDDHNDKLSIGRRFWSKEDREFTHVLVVAPVNENSGKVGINVYNPQYELDVNGTIRAKEVRVESGWADFVFKKDYQLPSLQEVKTHIDEHQHLPGIPSEAEVKENGVGLAEMTTKLLQKVEELTLYAIQQQETIEKLNNKVQELENTKK